ncbi:MAG TPA: hypothetical protein VJX10_09125 [Pseudonocardiaceae bacterium]|nr:hypothetical protein [Pseudonocardiaceae bacterium]
MVPARVDAVVVPSMRPGVTLRTAVGLAAAHRCPVVMLHSGPASVYPAHALAVRAGVEFVGIGKPAVRLAAPQLECDELLQGTVFARTDDLSAKRNLGLLLAMLAGWRRIAFLDDDIDVLVPDDLGRAAALTRRYPVVGLGLAGFPDNSVVCHANRAVGGFQEMFIGGGALVVDVQRCDSPMPNVYNDDWMFMLTTVQSAGAAVTGQAFQAWYDPYADAERARSQEFGDCLAEGLFALLDDGRALADADLDYWRDFLTARQAFIGTVIDRIGGVGRSPHERHKMRRALDAAAERCRDVTPELCRDYLAAWQVDRDKWRSLVPDYRRTTGESRLDEALAELGITRYARRAQATTWS